MVTIHKLLTRHCTVLMICHHEFVYFGKLPLRYNQVDWTSVIGILDTAVDDIATRKEVAT